MTDELSGAIRIRGVYNAEGDPGLVGISLFGRVLAGAGRVFGGRLFAGEVPDYTEGAVLQREADDNYGAFSQFSVRMSFSDLDDVQYRNLFGTPLDSVRPLFSFLRLQTRRYPDPKWIDRFRGMVRRAQLTRGVLSIDTTDAIYRLRQSRLVFEWQDEGMLLRKNNDGEYEIESEDETSFTNGLNRVDPLFRECRIDDGAFTERRVDIYPFQVEENIFRISRARRVGTKTYLQFSQDADFHLPATIFSRKPIEFPTGNPVEILRMILSEKNVDGKFRYVTEGEDNWDPEMYDSSRRACDYTPVRVRLFSGGEESVYRLCNALAQICNASFGWNGFGLFVFDALRPHPRPGVPGKVLIGDESAWGFSYEDTVDNLHTSFQVDYDWADDDKQYGPRNMRRIKYDFEELLPDLPPENILERRGRLLLADRRIDLDFPYVRLNSVARVAVMRRSREELARRRRLDLSMHALDQDSYELEIGDYVDVHPEEYPPYAGDISQFHVPTVPMRIRGRSVDLDTGRVDISAAPYAIVRHGLFDSGRAPGVIRVCGVWNDLVGSHVDAIAYFGNTVGEEISYWRRDPVTGKTYLGQIRLDGTRIARGLGENTVAPDPDRPTPPPPPPPPPPPVPKVDFISLYPKTAFIKVGETIQLTATAFSYVTLAPGEIELVAVEGVDFDWTSSVDSVATVSNTGLITGVNGSETGLDSTITVRARGRQATAVITVRSDPPSPVLTTIVVAPASASVQEGDTLQLAATGYDQYGVVIAAAITWASDDGAIATVDAAGLVTAVDAGATAITASSGTVSGTAQITVTAPPPPPPPPSPVLTTIVVAPASASVQEGDTLQLAATGYDQYGVVIAAAITWASDDGAIATVDAAGLVTAVDAGATAITASSGTVSGTAQITVTVAPPPPPVLTTIVVAPVSASIEAGDTLQLAATGYDQYGVVIAAAITWASDDGAIATVDAAGLVTAVDAGATAITASSGTVSGTAQITVTAPPPPPPVLTTIVVAPVSASIEAGDTLQLAATGYDQSGVVIAAAITWASDDGAIATVDAAGLVTAVAVGDAEITASSGSISDAAQITVTPPPKPPCAVPAIIISGPDEVVKGERVDYTAVPQDGVYDRAQSTWSADRGSFGDGLWQAEYEAPDTIGEDELSVQIRIYGSGRLAQNGCTGMVTVTKTIDVVDPVPPPAANFEVSVIPRPQADGLGCQNSGVVMEYTTNQDGNGARVAFSYEAEGSGRVSSKFVDLETDADGGSRAELRIIDLDPNTRYVFGCQLYVDGAASGARLERRLTTSSNVPCIVTGEVLVQGQTAMLTWSENGDGGSPITRFEVWYESRTGSVSHNSQRIRVGGNSRSATLENLNWDTLYWAYIQAFNDVGGSVILRLDASIGEEVDICAFLQNPRTFSAFRRCSAIELSFKAPADSFTGLPAGLSAEPIKGYRIEYIRKDADPLRISWESVLVTTLPDQLDISETISGLDIDTAYLFKFFTLTQSCSSSGVERSYSTTPADTPDKVNGVSALPAGGTTDALDIAWDPNSGCSQNGFRYELRYRPTHGTVEWTDREGAIDDTALRLTGLLQDTYYDIQVRADNKQLTNNFGPWSDTASAKTNRVAAPPTEAPGRPLRPSVRGYSTNTAEDPARIYKLEVSWFRPANGGSPITGYQVRYRRGTIAWSTFSDPNYGTDIPADTLAVTLHSLNSGSLYQVQVRAKNHPDTIDVWGLWSYSGEASTGTIDSTEPPLAPGSHTVTNITHNSISTAWSRSPSREGVPDPDGYIVRYRVFGQENTEQTDTVGPEIFIYTFSGLLAFTTYDIWVAGYSNLHPRNDLNWTAVNPKPRTLDAPIFPRPVISSAPTLTTPSRGAILVDFPLIQAQGAAITGRFVEYREDAAGEDWIRADIGAASEYYTITSLEDDTDYRVRVLASNNAGTSEPSPEATATTRPAPAVTPPIDDPPENVSADFEPTTATISWQAPSAAGVFPAGYEVRYKKKTDTAWTPINGISDSSRSQEIAGLSLDTEYQLAVRSRYTQGDARSPWVEVSGRTARSAVPTVVPAPTVQNVSWLYGEPSARVCSEFPSDFGGIPVTGLSYRLYRFTDRGNYVRETSGTLWTSTRTYILLNGLVPDTEYQVEVAWRNAIGRATFSGRATFITPKTSDLATHSRIGGCS